MTLLSTTQRVVYVGTGAVSVYPYPFRVDTDGELRATRLSAAGVLTVLELGVHYGLTGLLSSGGGNLTLLDGPLEASAQLILERVPDFKQRTNLTNQRGFLAETHEATLDRLAMQTQRLAYLLGELEDDPRVPRLPDHEESGASAFDCGENRLADVGAPIDGADAVRLSDLEDAVDALATGEIYAQPVTESWTGDGTTQSFALTSVSYIPTNPAVWLVTIEGVEQWPALDYNIVLGSGTASLYFPTAPPNGTAIRARTLAYQRARPLPTIVNSWAALPFAEAAVHLHQYVVRETGQPDVLVACLASAAGAFDWVTIAVGPR